MIARAFVVGIAQAAAPAAPAAAGPARADLPERRITSVALWPRATAAAGHSERRAVRRPLLAAEARRRPHDE